MRPTPSLDVQIDDKTPRIQRLTAHNYPSWASEMKALLMSKGVWKCISGSVESILANPDASSELTTLEKLRLEEDDNKAMGLIALNISETYREKIRNATKSKQAWKTLEEFFEAKAPFNKVHLLLQLVSLKLTEGGDIEDYVRKKMQFQRRLENCGLKLPEELMTVLLLIGLPNELSTLRRILETDDNLTLDKVERELQNETIRRSSSSENSNQNSAIMLYGNSDLKAKEDHWKSKKRNRTRNEKEKHICSFCNKHCYHSEDSCYQNPESDNYRPNLIRQKKGNKDSPNSENASNFFQQVSYFCAEPEDSGMDQRDRETRQLSFPRSDDFTHTSMGDKRNFSPELGSDENRKLHTIRIEETSKYNFSPELMSDENHKLQTTRIEETINQEPRRTNRYEEPLLSLNTNDQSYIDDLRCLNVEQRKAIPGNWTSKLVLDSGCYPHMVGNPKLLDEIRPHVSNVHFGNDASIQSVGKGNIVLRNNGVTLSNCLFVPDLRVNLLSAIQLIRENDVTIILRRSGGSILDSKGLTLGRLKLDGNLYVLEAKDYITSSYTNVSLYNAEKGEIITWHHRLGHISESKLKKIGFKGQLPFCEVCAKGKLTERPFSRRENNIERILGRVHTDTVGPLPTGYNGELYFLTLVDEHSRYLMIEPLHSRSEVTSKLISMCKRLMNLTGQRLSRLRSDGAKEFTESLDLKQFLSNEGVEHESTVRYVPEMNGIAERINRTILDMARCMLIHANISSRFWPQSVLYATHIYNRIPHSKTGARPFDVLMKGSSDYSKLKIFGSVCYAVLPNEIRKKFDDKSLKGIFMGFTNTAYKIYHLDSGKLLSARSIKVNEDVFLSKEETDLYGISRDSEDNIPLEDESFHLEDIRPLEPGKNEERGVDSELSREAVEVSSEDLYLAHKVIPKHVEDETKAEHVTETTHRLPRTASAVAQIQISNILDSERNISYAVFPKEPENFQEAWSDEAWRNSMKEEYQSLLENRTWELIDRPKDRKCIKSGWVYKAKRNEAGSVYRLKSRLVAKGYSQVLGIDFNETFAPVGMRSTLRMLIAFSTKSKWTCRQVDVDTAFLYGNLEEEIYMEQPEGFTDGSNKVCRLKKSIYGLKQASRVWNETLDAALVSIGYHRSICDPCLYVKPDSLLFVYVDDMVICSLEVETTNLIIQELGKLFKLKDLGKPSWILGLELIYEREGTIITQRTFIDSLLKACDALIPASTPMDSRTQFTKDHSDSVSIEMKSIYRSWIGSLLYIASGTRFDIAYAIGILAQFVENPSSAHVKGLKRVLGYLKATQNYGLYFSGTNSSLDLRGYCDADFASCIDSRRSRTGFVMFFGNCLVSWSSRKHGRVTLSTCEAEYYAACEAAKEGIHISRLAWEINNRTPFKESFRRNPIKILCDNQSCIKVCKNPEKHKIMKHGDVRLKWLRERVKDSSILLEYVKSSDQLADILTKAVSKPILKKLVSECGLKDLGAKDASLVLTTHRS
jgi:hypothetical protein